jgi:hypothetical protein
MACNRSGSCDGDYSMLLAVLAVGMLAPAWIAALLGSELLRRR